MSKQHCRQKFETVTIRGYKSIAYDNPVTLKLGDVNILLGANGAGKSNIVTFFKMLSYMMSRKFAAYVEQAGTSGSILHYGPQITPKLSGELQITDSVSSGSYSFVLENAAPDRLIITDEHLTWQKDIKQQPYEVKLVSNFKESSLVENPYEDARSIYKLLSLCKVYQFHDSSAMGPLRRSCPMETADYLQTEGNNLPSFLYFLRENHTEEYTRISEYVRDVIPQFDEFYLEPRNEYISLRWKDCSANDYVFNSSQLSDGSIRFIALAALLLQPEKTMPNVIILDEPELGLHPYAITQLSEMIKDASRHAQILIATQSKDLVDYFEIENISVVEMEKGCTKVNHLTAEEYHLWLEQYSISELWDKNIIGGRPV